MPLFSNVLLPIVIRSLIGSKLISSFEELKKLSPIIHPPMVPSVAFKEPETCTSLLIIVLVPSN
jgi:hypothetical protein